MSSDDGRPTADNPLAPVLAETIRVLADVRLLHAAERDYLSWLQAEVLRARQWTMPGLVRAWHQELDRREHGRATVRGDRQAA